MFREIRRNKKQVLSDDVAAEILDKSTSGVLSLLGDDGYTYGVPLSYSYRNNKLYFHCAKQGHKIDAVKKHDKVSFTVIETDQIVPAEFTTYFRSVIAFGKIRLVENESEIKEAMGYLVEKYSPDFIAEGEETIVKQMKALQVMVLDIQHLSGKEAIEFAKKR